VDQQRMWTEEGETRSLLSMRHTNTSISQLDLFEATNRLPRKTCDSSLQSLPKVRCVNCHLQSKWERLNAPHESYHS